MANGASGFAMDVVRKHVLLGDIGATNARFALLSNGALGPIRNFSVADFPHFTRVIDAGRDGAALESHQSIQYAETARSPRRWRLPRVARLRERDRI